MEDDVNSGSEQTLYPAEMVSSEYDSGFNNWSNWGNGPSDPARTEKDITETL